MWLIFWSEGCTYISKSLISKKSFKFTKISTHTSKANPLKCAKTNSCSPNLFSRSSSTYKITNSTIIHNKSTRFLTRWHKPIILKKPAFWRVYIRQSKKSQMSLWIKCIDILTGVWEICSRRKPKRRLFQIRLTIALSVLPILRLRWGIWRNVYNRYRKDWESLKTTVTKNQSITVSFTCTR
jgi:hypothetical protein